VVVVPEQAPVRRRAEAALLHAYRLEVVVATYGAVAG
jgi:hypothetical protein